MESACLKFLEENMSNGKLIIDGIFFSTDNLALRVKKIIESYGISISDDVSLIGYDGIKLVPKLGYFVSSIRQPIDLVAKKCVEITYLMINKKTAQEINGLPIAFVEGGTTK